jgi:hypothetical protein
MLALVLVQVNVLQDIVIKQVYVHHLVQEHQQLDLMIWVVIAQLIVIVLLRSVIPQLIMNVFLIVQGNPLLLIVVLAQCQTNAILNTAILLLAPACHLVLYQKILVNILLVVIAQLELTVLQLNVIQVIPINVFQLVLALQIYLQTVHVQVPLNVHRSSVILLQINVLLLAH